MYPNLYYAFRDLFGFEIPLKVVNSFFFVAIAFLLSARLLIKIEEKGKRSGYSYLHGYNYYHWRTSRLRWVTDQFLTQLFFLDSRSLSFDCWRSIKRSAGIYIFKTGKLAGGNRAGPVLYRLEMVGKTRPGLKSLWSGLYESGQATGVGDITIIAAVAGLLALKYSTTWKTGTVLYKTDRQLISPSGLTFYGGLICCHFTLWYYFRKKG